MVIIMEKLMPREKIIKLGVESLEDYELLAILLQTGNKKENVLQLSKRILTELNLNDLINMQIEDWMIYDGIKTCKAASLIAFLEFSKRIYKYQKKDIFFKNSNDVFEYVKYDLSNKSHEELIVLYVNARCRLISVKKIKGNVNILYVDTKEIVNNSLKCKAKGVFLIHNHPSGDINPSVSDIDLTNNLNNAFSYFDVKLLDHLIIGDNNYFSFSSNNLLKK